MMKKIRKLWALALLTIVSLSISMPAQATLLSGSFTIVGLEDVRVGTTTINWGEQADNFGTPTGSIFFPTGDGDFTSFSATLGTIRDLNAVTEPIETPLMFHNFVVAAAQPTWDFVLTRILAGGGSPAQCDDNVGSVCTPPGSPFTITNNTAQTGQVAITFHGYVTDGSSDPPSPWIATFSTPVNNTAGEIIAQILARGFYQTASAGRFDVTAIPEPETFGIIGFGLIALGILTRRRKISS